MSTFSPSLRIELIDTGSQAGVWGTTTNTNLGTLIESAIAGYVSVLVTSANQAFTALDGAADQARNMSIALTTSTTDVFNVYAPPAEKTYVIYNASAYVATIYNSTVRGNTTAAGAGVAIPSGKTMTVWSDGTNFQLQNTHIVGTVVGDVTGNVTGTAAQTDANLAASGGSTLVGFLPAGTGAVPTTIQSKLREIPSTLDFATQADIQASGLNWFFMPFGESLNVSGAITKNFWGPGKATLPGGDVPGTQGAAGYGMLVLESIEPSSGQHFAFASKVFTGTRTDQSSASGQNHGVAIYGEAQRGAGSSDAIWALNTVTESFNLDGATIGYEIDVNNKSGIDPGLNPAQPFHALSLISGAAGRGGTAIVIDRNGDFTGNEWNRGLHIKEVLLRGIEFTNCGNASGFWTDTTLSIKGTSAAVDPLVKFLPYDDTDQSAYLWYAANAADTAVLGGLLKRGELTINEPSGKGAAGLSIKGIDNGDDIVFLQRNTDTAPVGTFLRAVNAANSSVLFDIDQNTTAAETNLRLSVAGASAVRVSIGAADSGGTGFRVLRIPN